MDLWAEWLVAQLGDWLVDKRVDLWASLRAVDLAVPRVFLGAAQLVVPTVYLRAVQ